MPAAERVAVASDEPLLDDDGYDYADAFEIEISESDPRTAEEFARDCLEKAPAFMRSLIWNVHRHVLRVRQAPRSSPDHVLGWTVVASEPDAVRLAADSPVLGRASIVGRRVEPTRVRVTTYIRFTRPALATPLWTAVGPLHRRVAPYLLERAAAGAPSAQRSAL